MVNDKHGFIESLSEGRCDNAILELGVGDSKKYQSSIGVDILDTDSVDIVGDVIEVLALIPSGSISKIHSNHFLEHVENIDVVIAEMARVLAMSGRISVVVPHFSNPFFYSDPTHKNHFGLYTFCYYASAKQFSREVPSYIRTNSLDLLEVKLVFMACKGRYVRSAFRKVLNYIFNASSYFQELFEESFCWIFPCYEIRYELQKTPFDE